MRNNKKKMILVSILIVSLILLVAAGFANAAVMSGYTAFEQGIINTLNLRNATINMTATLSINGSHVQDEDGNFTVKADLDNKMIYDKSSNGIGAGQQYTDEHYYTADKQITIYNGGNPRVANNSDQKFDSITNFPPQAITVAQIMVDALSGNAKDYFNIADNSDGGKTVTANLTAEQMPDIVDAAANLAISMPGRAADEAYVPNGLDTPYEALGNKIQYGFIKQAKVMAVNISAALDKDGNLTFGQIDVTINFTDQNGAVDIVAATVSCTVTDIGTTRITPPNVSESSNAPGASATPRPTADPLGAASSQLKYTQSQVGKSDKLTDAQKAQINDLFNQIGQIINDAKAQ